MNPVGIFFAIFNFGFGLLCLKEKAKIAALVSFGVSGLCAALAVI